MSVYRRTADAIRSRRRSVDGQTVVRRWPVCSLIRMISEQGRAESSPLELCPNYDCAKTYDNLHQVSIMRWSQVARPPSRLFFSLFLCANKGKDPNEYKELEEEDVGGWNSVCRRIFLNSYRWDKKTFLLQKLTCACNRSIRVKKQ